MSLVQAQPVNITREEQPAWALVAAPAGARTLTLTVSNTVLTSGKLAMPHVVFLVLGPQCSNVVFQDVAFDGNSPHPPTPATALSPSVDLNTLSICLLLQTWQHEALLYLLRYGCWRCGYAQRPYCPF